MAGRPEKPVVFVQHTGHMPLVQKALPVQHMPPQGQQGLTCFQALFLDEADKGLYGRDVLPVDKVFDRKNPSSGLPLVRSTGQLPGRLCCQTRPVAPCCRGNQCGWLIPGHVSSPAAGPGRPLVPIAPRKPCAGMRTADRPPGSCTTLFSIRFACFRQTFSSLPEILLFACGPVRFRIVPAQAPATRSRGHAVSLDGSLVRDLAPVHLAARHLVCVPA